MTNAQRRLSLLLDSTPNVTCSSILRGTVTSSGRIVTSAPVALTDDERCYFDERSARDFRSMMQGNRAPFLS